MWGLGPNMARQRMKEEKERSVFEDIDRGKKLKEERIEPKEHHHTPLRENKKVKKFLGGVSSSANFVEQRLPKTPQVGKRARKGIYNINRGFNL